jgi:hypothetical protein
MAGVRCCQRPFPTFARSVRTGWQKLALYMVKYVAASCAAQSLLNRYVFRTFRLFRCRSLPFCLSTKPVFTVVLTIDNANAASTAALAPNTTFVSTRTTRLFSRSLCTVAYFSPFGSRRYGFRGRPAGVAPARRTPPGSPRRTPGTRRWSSGS